MGHILIVDDMPDNRRMFSEILECLGHTYELAATTQEAVMKCSGQIFDLIFMDISIPLEKGRETDLYGGIKATKIILSLPKCRNIPIIAVTAHGMESQKKVIMDSGVRALVEKGTERFMSEIERYLSDHLPVQSAPVEVEDLASMKTVECFDLQELRQLEASVTKASVPAQESNSTAVQPPENVTSQSRKEPGDELDAYIAGSVYEELRNAKEVRAATAEVIMRAVVSTERLGRSLRELDRDQGQIESVNRLHQQLTSIHRKLNNPTRDEGEEKDFQHWLVNIMILAPEMVSKIEKREMDDFHGQLSDEIIPIQGIVRDVMRFAKSPHTKIESSVAPKNNAQAPLIDLKSEGVDEFVANVLIVDDSSEARMDLEEKVRKLKHRPYSCSSAEDALNMLSFRPFDVCLLDMHMPGIDGLEMIRRIRATAKTLHLPIIVVSGSCHDSTGADAIEMGANDFLSKPAVERLLQARINACLRQTLARKAELAKFLPEGVIESVLLDESVLHIPKIADITVMVCDIRGFSKISETRNPVETIGWISDVMNRLSNIILSFGGTIVDYVGDEIMAMWGAPGESLTHPEEACKCAVMIQAEVAKLSIQWYPRLMTALEIGIGIHSGMAVCGNTGSKKRIKYGPLGNTVNLASRVQGTTKFLHSAVLITSDTANRVSPQLRGRRICKIRVQNMSKPVELYELSMQTGEDYRQVVRPLNQYYEKALEAFEDGDIQDALKRTAQILVEHPNDGPSKLLMLRVLQANLEQKFDPVWTMPGK